MKHALEPNIEGKFHKWSYGCRPNRSAIQAVVEVRENSRAYNWVVDLDIKGFFDSIDHTLLIKALNALCDEKWIILYVERWLKAGVMEGNQVTRSITGTPQGGVISPLLANILLSVAFDWWMKILYPDVKFVRYMDDIVVHCKSKNQAVNMM